MRTTIRITRPANPNCNYERVEYRRVTPSSTLRISTTRSYKDQKPPDASSTTTLRITKKVYTAS